MTENYPESPDASDADPEELLQQFVLEHFRVERERETQPARMEAADIAIGGGNGRRGLWPVGILLVFVATGAGLAYEWPEIRSRFPLNPFVAQTVEAAADTTQSVIPDAPVPPHATATDPVDARTTPDPPPTPAPNLVQAGPTPLASASPPENPPDQTPQGLESHASMETQVAGTVPDRVGGAPPVQPTDGAVPADSPDQAKREANGLVPSEKPPAAPPETGPPSIPLAIAAVQPDPGRDTRAPEEHGHIPVSSEATAVPDRREAGSGPGSPDRTPEQAPAVTAAPALISGEARAVPTQVTSLPAAAKLAVTTSDDQSLHGKPQPPAGDPAAKHARKTRHYAHPDDAAPVDGETSSATRYLQEARRALVTGRGGAPQSLEMAQTRLLTRATSTAEVQTPSQSAVVKQITEARSALAAGDRERAVRLIEEAIPVAGSGAR